MQPRRRAVAALFLAGLATFGARPAASPAADDKARSGVSAEAATWLAMLRDASTSDLKYERVLVVDTDGRILDRADGREDSVEFPSRFLLWLRQPEADVTLVHNHPGNTGFSEQDFSQLGHPGVGRIIAVGNDGSFYEARRGPAFNVENFSKVTYPMARAAQERVLHSRADCFKLDERVKTHFAHALGLRMAKAGVIEYRAELDRQRQSAWDSVRVWYGVTGR